MIPKALAFDVFGTVVDWRTGIARASAAPLAALGRPDIDPAGFADAWRARYQPAMAAVREGRRPFVVLDVLHHEMLEATLEEAGIAPTAIDPVLLADWTLAWHRLDPWPDAVDGMRRLRKRMPAVAMSNGNVALQVALARHGGLAWDAVLGAEFARAYKPAPETYLGAAAALGIAPGELCMVAAHHSDLAAARSHGLLTAFVERPLEHGGRPAPDADQRQAWDWQAGDFADLADQLGC